MAVTQSPLISLLFACSLSLLRLPTTHSQHVQHLRGRRELDAGAAKGGLRVATFGSSNTWGAGLDNRYDAYPYLLSPEVHNYASFAAGPNYLSVCTETEIGDDNVYDVILLDYWLRASEGLVPLSRRLRNRFPKAIMMYLRLANPTQARRKSSETDPQVGVTFKEWKMQNNFQGEEVDELIHAVERDTGFWYFPYDHQMADAIVEFSSMETGGYELKLPEFETGKETLMHHLRFFDKNHHALLNERGHELIANVTRAVIHDHVPRDIGALLESAEYETWDRGDKCQLWITTGGCTLPISYGLIMKEFDTRRGRFGLEVRREGWIDVTNPFDDDRPLYVSFMAHNSTLYPEMKLVHGDFEQVLNPVTIFDRHFNGVTRTVPAGMFPPGTHRVTLTALMNRDYQTPFLLLGISFTNGAVPSEFGFGPEFN